MEKKKILYLITKSNFGGAQKYVFDLATHLPKDKYDVAVAAGGMGEKNAPYGALKEKLEEKNIRFIPLPHLTRNIFLLNDLKSLLDLILLFKKERPDVIHLNSSKMGGLGALAGRIYNFLSLLSTHHFRFATIVFTAHGFAFFEERPWYQLRLIKMLSWYTVWLSTKTIVITEKEKKLLEKWPYCKKKIELIRNGIAPEAYLDKSEARKKVGELSGVSFSGDTFLMGSIGELHKNKGYEYAFEALSKLTFPFKYFVIGSGAERKNLEDLIVKRGLAEKVYLLGNVPNASRLLKAFDLFLLPSIKEGLPYVLLEAGFAGVPGVATSVGGIKDVVSDLHNGLVVEPKNSRAIADAISYIQNNKNEAEKMAMSLQKKCQEDFSLEKMVIHTLDLYKS